MEKIKILLQKTVNFAKARPILSIVGLLVVVIVGFMSLGNQSTLADYDIDSVERRDVESIVDVTGKVRSADKVDLGLERGGKIARIEVDAGDRVYAGQTLVVTSNADLWASLDEARANLAIERLNLEETRTSSAVSESTALVDLESALRDSYIAAEDAIYNQLSEIFRGSNSNSTYIGIVRNTGTINYLGLTVEERLDISYERRRLDEDIETWENSLNSLSANNVLETADMGVETLTNARAMINSITSAFNDYTIKNASDRDELDQYRQSIYTASSLVGNALTDLRSAKQVYLSEVAALGLNTDQEHTPTLLQQERVKIAEARVNSILADIAKTTIRAPFSGVVTKVDAEVGEIVSSNTPVVSVISDQAFEVEVYIPEVDIAGLEEGTPASATLDAYSSEDPFAMEVVYIDPAETMIEGVSTYKALLHFNETDERILSGMTANVNIVIGEAEDVLAIPRRAVIEQNGRVFVRVLGENDELIETAVETGLSGVDGYVEILSGLSEGDQVVVYVRS